MERATKTWLLELADRCRECREKASLSFRAAAKAAGVSVSTIQRTEAGDVDTGADVLRKLAEAYGVDLCQLITGRPVPKK